MAQMSTGRLMARMLSEGMSDWRRCLAVLALNLALSLLGLLGLNLVGLGIDVLHHAVTPGAPQPRGPLGWSPDPSGSVMGQVGVIALGSLGLGLVVFALRVVSSRVQAVLVQDLMTRLRQRCYDKLQRLSFRFFDASDSGSIINRVTGDVRMMQQFVEAAVLQMVTLTILTGVYLVYMARIDAWLTLACAAPLPVLGWVSVRFGEVVRPGFDENRLRLDRLLRTLTESVQGVHVVKGFAREPFETRRFEAANDDLTTQQDRIFRQQGYYRAWIEVWSQLSLVILLGYGGYLAVRGELALGGGLVVFASLLNGLSGQVTNMAQVSNVIQQSLASAQRVYEVLDTPLEVRDATAARELPRVEGRVAFEGVTFAYKPNQPVLEEVSLAVRPGECVAVLGETGAGKSTLLSLIPRFYDPTAGRVLVDGHDVRTLRLDELRRAIGLVFQDSFLFSNTVAANIAFGEPGASMERIVAAAKIACAHGFIEQLPRGYDTIIGERGMDLSGGQRQRLAIARALLLEPRILIMDDPTASIDPATEDEILQAMDAAMVGRTTFIVAHRLSTLRRADRIIVLQRGRVVQTGTHADLLGREGLYRHAAAIQSTGAVT